MEKDPISLCVEQSIHDMSVKYLGKYLQGRCDLETVIDLALLSQNWSIWSATFHKHPSVVDKLTALNSLNIQIRRLEDTTYRCPLASQRISLKYLPCERCTNDCDKKEAYLAMKESIILLKK